MYVIICLFKVVCLITSAVEQPYTNPLQPSAVYFVIHALASVCVFTAQRDTVNLHGMANCTVYCASLLRR